MGSGGRRGGAQHQARGGSCAGRARRELFKLRSRERLDLGAGIDDRDECVEGSTIASGSVSGSSTRSAPNAASGEGRTTAGSGARSIVTAGRVAAPFNGGYG